MLRYLLTLAVIFVWSDVPALAGTCYGRADCSACKNCRYCKNCNSGGTPCGVWQITHGQQQSSIQAARYPGVATSSRIAPINRGTLVPAIDAMPPVAPPISMKASPSITEYRSKPKASKEDPFVANVRRRIAASWGTYPACDLTARIYFEIDQSGDLINLKVLSASGDPEGIGQAVDAIKCATPFGTPSQTERFVINFKDGQMDYSPEMQRFQTTSIQLVPKAAETVVPTRNAANFTGLRP